MTLCGVLVVKQETRRAVSGAALYRQYTEDTNIGSASVLTRAVRATRSDFRGLADNPNRRSTL